MIQGSGDTEITVALSDGREFPAKVILKDEQTDLAVLRLDAKGAQFPVIEFANSDSLEVGDLVLAIGDPFGVGQTVTSGIVSALARTQVGISNYQFFIQTDAAINPGNSGGALVDMDGKLVGINTAIFSRAGGSLGIGFAIPSNMVWLVVQSALKGGETVQRPWLGATLQPVTQDIANSLGLPTQSGALVAKVSAKGPAAKAGLVAGDVVVGVDDKEVNDPQAFEYRFITKGIGGSAELTLLRKGQRLKSTIALLAPVRIRRATPASSLATIRCQVARSPICRLLSPRSSASTMIRGGASRSSTSRTRPCRAARYEARRHRRRPQRSESVVGRRTRSGARSLGRCLAALSRARREAVQYLDFGLIQ